MNCERQHSRCSHARTPPCHHHLDASYSETCSPFGLIASRLGDEAFEPGRGEGTLILSPGTRGYDMLVKRPFYAEVGVRHLWYIDPEARTVAVSRLEAVRWLELGIFGGEQAMRAEPFEAVEIPRAAWWEGITPEAPA